MKIKPLFDKAICKKISKTVTDTGIILSNPDSVKPYYEGEVVAVGQDCKQLKVGDIVAMSYAHGINWEEDKVEYRMFREQDLLGIVE
jgi:co-chaperonin GroES (HSP10)